MKRFVAGIISAIVIFSFSAAAFANSGPVFWQGYPSSSAIMLIDDSSPILIENENLVFDFSDSGSDFTINGKVTATYDMLNPTSAQQLVQMAFPFVGTLSSLLQNNIVITADGSLVPYTVYIGDVVESYGYSQEDKEAGFDFANIVKTLTNRPYRAVNFSENEKGKLYVIEVKPTTGQSINFAVDFNFNAEKTKVLTNGFNRYERNSEKTRIAAWRDNHNTQVLEIFVLGEDIELNINGYTDGELSEKTDLFTYQVSTRQLELKPYLTEFIKKNTRIEDTEIISGTQLYNLYAKSLDEHFTLNRGYAYGDDLAAQEHYMRILTLVYAVEFDQSIEKVVSVSYRTSGTMDMTKTAKPLYSFDYIFNPAKNWGGFKNLYVEIIAPQEAPYIVKSSIEFIKKENHVYTATLAGLPEDDLSFTLYADENITLSDRAIGKLQNIYGYFAPFVIGATALLIFGGIVVILTLKRKRIEI
jgi:hypothetical protein